MPLGSSPRMRGKRGRRCQEDSRARLIPAHAGKTPWCRPIDPSFGAHPRACGENLVCTDCAVSCAGSSPRMRGKQGSGRKELHQGGAHPRACGENLIALRIRRSPAGSSPRMRGKPVMRIARPMRRGLIPAHAGKTPGVSLEILPYRGHPRACGENSLDMYTQPRV